MKKFLSVLLALCMLLGCTSAAFAASKPTVAFTAKNGYINGGLDYELGIKISSAPAADLPVDIVNNMTGEALTITIPAGATTASAIIPTEVVTERTQESYSFVKTDAYQTGTLHVLTIYTLPRVQFYAAVNHGTIGTEMSVLVQCKNPNSVLSSNNVFLLKDDHGNVLCERKWTNASNRLSFKFTPTEEHYGKTKFTVWLGDFCVTEDDGYGTIARPGEKIVTETTTDLPIMAIGIDCGFEGRRTYDILDTLAKHNVKVTFFMTGYFLREFPEECKAIYAAGHEIATHSNTHKHLKDLSAHAIYEQLTIPIREAEELLAVTPRLFRPPYGEYNKYITGISRAEGMQVVMWGPTYHDSTGKYTEAQIMRLATTGNDYKPGTIVLCHIDGYYQPASLEAGLTHYESLGLTVVPISALICASGQKLTPMPDDREALVYTDEYWETWIERNVPHLLEGADE